MIHNGNDDLTIIKGFDTRSETKKLNGVETMKDAKENLWLKKFVVSYKSMISRWYLIVKQLTC